MQETEERNYTGDDYFGAIEREDWDFESAIQDPDIETGRSGRGIVRIGLFGGKAVTDNPDSIEGVEDHTRGVSFVRNVCRAAQNVADFPGHVQFPKEIESAIHSKSSRTDPFGTYQFTLWVSDTDNRGPTPLIEGLVEYFETEHEGRYDPRGIEFDYDYVDPSEKFRAVFPWAKREKELEINDALEGYDGPKPLKSLVRSLQETPMACRDDYHRMTVSVHYYNYRQDTDGKYDRELELSDFYSPNKAYFIEKDRRDDTQKALDNARVDTRNTSVSYELDVTIDRADVKDAIAEEDNEVTIAGGFAQQIGQRHYVENYGGKSQNVSVGVVDVIYQTEEEFTFKLSVTAVER